MATRKTAWNQAVPSHAEIHDAKRRAVLREAAASFNRIGFYATTLDDIAKRLGVTKAALYYYFPNKNALLKACFDEVMAGAFENLEAARAVGQNGRERLKLVFIGYLRQFLDELTVAVVVMEDSALNPEEQEVVHETRDRFERALRELVEEGIADGSIIPCDAKLVVLAMLGAVHWVPRWFRREGTWSVEQLAQAISDLLERAISPKPLPLVRRVTDIDPDTAGSEPAKVSALKKR
jgi:TetR/AcrR family transcriptional regulator